MANSFQSWTWSTGDPLYRLVTIDFLSQDEVHLYDDGVEVPFTWDSSSQISFSAPANGSVMNLKRETDIDTRDVDFEDGNGLSEEDLDNSALQIFYKLQELAEAQLDGVVYDAADNKQNAQSKVIKNVADGVNNNDAVNVSQLQAAAIGKVPLTDITDRIAQNESDIAAIKTDKADDANVIKKDGSVSATDILSYADASSLSIDVTSAGDKNKIPSCKAVNDALNAISLTAGVEYVKNLIWQQDTDTDHDINFYSPNTSFNSEVLMRDSSNNIYMRTKAGSTEMTKRIDATWAAGDDAGGLDDNDTLASNQVLYGFRLGKTTDDTAIDYILSDDRTGASALTDTAVVSGGWDLISVAPVAELPPLDGSSNIIGHAAYEIEGGGAEVYLNSSVNDVSSISTSYAAETLTVPPNSFAKYTCFTSKNAEIIITCRVDSTSEVIVSYKADVNANYTNSANGYIKVDSSNQVEMKSSVAVDIFKWYTSGYKVSRRA